jgi:hypothetical protein
MEQARDEGARGEPRVVRALGEPASAVGAGKRVPPQPLHQVMEHRIVGAEISAHRHRRREVGDLGGAEALHRLAHRADLLEAAEEARVRVSQHLGHQARVLAERRFDVVEREVRSRDDLAQTHGGRVEDRKVGVFGGELLL